MSLVSRMIRRRACNLLRMTCCSSLKKPFAMSADNTPQVARLKNTACIARLSTSSCLSNQTHEVEVTPECAEEASPTTTATTTLHQRQSTEALLKSSLQQDDYFGLKTQVTLNQLFEARVHLGHNCGLRHPSMTPYIFGERQGTDIIDLEQTLPLLRHALDLCAHIVYRGGMVLFLCRNQQVLPLVEKMALEVGEYAHCRPWKRGIFTDATNTFGTFPVLPELCVFFTTQDSVFETHRAIVEASKLLVPSVAVVDTNSDIKNVAYPVPGNDDSPAAMHLYIELFRRAVLTAKARRKEDGL